MGKVPENLNMKGGDGSNHRWVQVLLSPDVHKRLKHTALDRGVTLKKLLEDIVTNFVNKESNHGRRSNTKESQKAF